LWHYIGFNFSLPSLTQKSDIITTNMMGVSDISISLDKTQWPLENLASNTEYATNSPPYAMIFGSWKYL